MPNFSKPRKTKPPEHSGTVPAVPLAITHRKADDAVGRKRRLLFAALASAVPAAALGAFACLEWWPASVCRRWEARLATCSDAEVPAHIECLAGCGSRGEAALVRLLAAPRPSVAEAAHQALAAQLRRLANNDDAIAAAEAEVLADALEQLAATTTVGVPAPAAALAWDILEATGRLSLDARLSKTTRGRLLVACRELLDRPVLPQAAEPAAAAVAAKPQQPTPPAVDRPKLTALAAREVPTTSAKASPPAVSATVPQAMNSGRAAAQPSLAVESVVSDRSAANATARVNPIRGTRADQQVRQASTQPSLSVPSPSQWTARPDAALQSRTAWSLFAEIGADQTAATISELRRRGFTEREIDLGRHLTCPDADERLRYTQILPSLAGASLKPWLLHLSADDDSEVRRACVAIMATQGDPAIIARVRDMAFTDRDEEVRSQAARLLDQSGRR